MIKIKMHQEEWRLGIVEEEFQFATRKEMETCLKYILDLKDKHGRLKNDKD